jgi:hypothetical protein
MRDRRFSPLPGLALLLAAVAGCGPPPGSEAPISPEAAAAPTPRLAETARFDAPLAAAGPDAEQLRAGADALAARAAGLRARGAGLGAPVIDPAERRRLEAAVSP